MSPEKTDLFVKMGEPAGPASLMGGKGRNLAILSQNGVSVPRWIVLTTKVFERLLGESLARIDAMAAECGPARPPAMLSREIQARIEGASFDPELRAEIFGAVQALVADRPGAMVAVRSSAVDEDSAGYSFAGQLDSYLFQPVDQGLFHCIQVCMASAFNERSLAYRLANGISLTDIRTAVVVQEMVFGEVSGVAFTANPINANPEQCVVSAVYGVGEGVVSGALDCDEWVLDSAGGIVRQQLADKSEQIVFDESSGKGTRKVAVEASRRRESSLGADQLKTLFETCRRIEQQIHLGQPQDIEWCLRGRELFILQARPIAAFAAVRKSGRHIVFDNSNVVESYAGVPTPLTYSFASSSFRATFRGVFERLGMPEARLRELEPLFANLLAYVHGRMYYNLLNWYRYFQEIPIGGDNIREFDQLIGIPPENAVEAPADSSGGRRFSRRLQGLRLAWKIRRIKAVARDFERHFFRGNGKYVNELFRTQDNARLLEIYREVFHNGSPYWDGEIVNFIGAQRGLAALTRMLHDLGITNIASVRNDLLGGDGGIASLRPTREMMEIADQIRANDIWRARFLSETPEALRGWLLGSGEPQAAPLRAKIEFFLEEYGCRCMNELKLEEPTLREEPAFLFATLRSYVAKKPVLFDTQLESQVEARGRAEALVFSRTGLWGRFHLKRAIAKVRRHVYYREELRLVRGKYWGIVRRIFGAIGRNFQKQGMLQDWNDIFLLKVDEIAELVEGRSPDLGHLPELLALRRSSRAADLLRATPSRIHSYGDVCAENFVLQSEGTRARPSGQSIEGVSRGIACGPGIARGLARVALTSDDAMGLDGQILVTERTDPGWIPLYPSISGLVIERGSVLSHSAVVAREMGIPTVVGVSGATQLIRTNDEIIVDGSQGTVQLVRRPNPPASQ